MAVATPSAQAAVAATKSIPIVFAAVTDPVAAKLVKSWQPSGTNVTGDSDALPLAAQIDLLLKVKPDAKRVGFVYSPGEANSTIVLKALKAELGKRGMSVASRCPTHRRYSFCCQKPGRQGGCDLHHHG